MQAASPCWTTWAAACCAASGETYRLTASGASAANPGAPRAVRGVVGLVSASTQPAPVSKAAAAAGS
ncbi:MAG: hypothetical protein MUC85_05940 [Anaerolineales bacterium]|nr:hypothetical protein [Anaerolineales bacterium]